MFLPQKINILILSCKVYFDLDEKVLVSNDMILILFSMLKSNIAFDTIFRTVMAVIRMIVELTTTYAIGVYHH